MTAGVRPTPAAEATQDAPWIDSSAVAIERPPSDPTAKTVPQGGRLRGLIEYDPSSWDVTEYSTFSVPIDFITCSTLVGYPTTPNATRNLELRPELAAAMPRVSPDGLTYVFELRHGVHFSDGRTLTAEDVRASFLRMFDPLAGFATTTSDARSRWDAVLGLRDYREGRSDDIPGIVADGDTVTFTLEHADGAFLSVLAYPLACVVPADAPHETMNLPPPTTGPYVVSGHESGRSLTLERNPWWGANVRAGLPVDENVFNVDGFDFTIGVAPEGMSSLLESGRADFSLLGDCCRVAARVLRRDPNTSGRFHATAGPVLHYAAFDVDAEPFDDPRVRRAVNLGLDRWAIVEAVGGPVLATPMSGLLHDAIVPPTFRSPYPLHGDRAAARALLRAAGLRLPVDGGELWFADDPWQASTAPALAMALRGLGIEMRLKRMDRETYYTAVQDDAEHDDAISLAQWQLDFPDASNVFDPLLLEDGIESGVNRGSFVSAALEAAYAEGVPIMQGPARREAFGRLARDLAVNEAPWIPLYAQNAVNLVSPRYGAYHFDPVKGALLGLAYVRR